MRFYLVAPWLMAFTVAALLGCGTHAGKESFERGQGLQRQQRYEDAVSMYEEAMAKEPGNPEYLQQLTVAKQTLLEKDLAGARTVLAAGHSFDNLSAALSETDKALALDPANKAARELAASIKSETELLVRRADELYAAAGKAAEAKSWTAATEKLTEIGSFYPNYLDRGARLEQLKVEGSAYYLKEAERLRAADDLSGALKSLSAGRQLQPADQRLAQLAAQIQEENTPKSYLAKAQAYVKKGDCDLALESIRRARELKPTAETLADIDKLHKEAAAILFDKSRQDLAARNLFGGYGNYLSALRFDAGAAQDAGNRELRDRLVAAMLEKAEAYEGDNKLGNALTWQEKALRLAASKEATQKIQILKEKLRQRVVKKIALMDFTSPSASQDAGRIVTDNLLSYLTRNSSGDIKILARDVLGTLLKEIELGQAGLYDIETAKKGGKLKGTDIFIFGSVLNYNVEKNVDEGQKMVNAVVGTKTIPNPAYQEWQQSHRNDQDRYPAPPQSIKEEIREIVKYKVATHKKTANVSVSFRVIDVEDGEVVITKTLKKKLEATDTYSEGVEFANIPFKELKLPSDSELLEQLVESVIAELGYAVLSRFQNLQVLYSNSAEMLKARGDAELVIERYTDAIIAEEIKNSPSQITEKAKAEIEFQLKTIWADKAAHDQQLAERAAYQKAQQPAPPQAKAEPEPVAADKNQGKALLPAAAAPAEKLESAKPAPAAAPAAAPVVKTDAGSVQPSPTIAPQGTGAATPAEATPPAAKSKSKKKSAKAASKATTATRAKDAETE